MNNPGSLEARLHTAQVRLRSSRTRLASLEKTPDAQLLLHRYKARLLARCEVNYTRDQCARCTSETLWKIICGRTEVERYERQEQRLRRQMQEREYERAISAGPWC